MNTLRILILCTALAWPAAVRPAFGQESDLEVKRNYEQTYGTIKGKIDSANTLAELDSLQARINALEAEYVRRSTFLDRALYPDNFSQSVRALRNYHGLTYERVYLIQTQGIAIKEYEARITALEGRIDSLTGQNRQIFADLKQTRQSLSQLRERVRRLSTAMLARDRLVFALVDTIFLPYDKDMQQVSDVQKDAIARKLLKSNVVARVYDIAADNMKFMEVTQLQGKDFKGMFDQLSQFQTKWTGLREKLNAVAVTSDVATLDIPAAGKGATPKATTPPAGGTPGKESAVRKAGTPAPEIVEPAFYVDSALAQWEARLNGALWSGLAREFATKGVPLRPFTDGDSFVGAVRSYVDSAKADGRDVSAFVNDVWKEKIDKEWREVLQRDGILGKTQYATLDKMVSEIGEKRFDLKFLLYILLAAVAAVLIYWVFGRKPKAEPQKS